MILIGLGANLPSEKFGTPIETLEACLLKFSDYGLLITARSRWFKSAPVPMSDQPWYINGVVSIKTGLEPRALLENLLRLEHEFGRIRSEANAPRVLDLDLITYNDLIIEDEGQIEDKPFCIPHPRMHERAFVLWPINDLNGDWQHPKLQKNLPDLISNLSTDQIIEPIGNI
jgi:2-amino-4-hydroxy-6-hydroxymethyldihydropteridine diphosphokinase